MYIYIYPLGVTCGESGIFLIKNVWIAWVQYPHGTKYTSQQRLYRLRWIWVACFAASFIDENTEPLVEKFLRTSRSQNFTRTTTYYTSLCFQEPVASTLQLTDVLKHQKIFPSPFSIRKACVSLMEMDQDLRSLSHSSK